MPDTRLDHVQNVGDALAPPEGWLQLPGTESGRPVGCYTSIFACDTVVSGHGDAFVLPIDFLGSSGHRQPAASKRNRCTRNARASVYQ